MPNLLSPMQTTSAAPPSGAGRAIFVIIPPLSFPGLAARALASFSPAGVHALHGRRFFRAACRPAPHGAKEIEDLKAADCSCLVSVAVRTERGARRGHGGGARARSERRDCNQRSPAQEPR